MLLATSIKHVYYEKVYKDTYIFADTYVLVRFYFGTRFYYSASIRVFS